MEFTTLATTFKSILLSLNNIEELQLYVPCSTISMDRNYNIQALHFTSAGDSYKALIGDYLIQYKHGWFSLPPATFGQIERGATTPSVSTT